MPGKRSSQPTFEHDGTSRDPHMTVDQMRTIRSEQAALAAVCADRYTEARAADSFGAMLRWAADYRRCAERCRRLGKRIRGEVSGSPAAAAERDPSIVPLARRRRPGAAPTGEAA